MSEIKYQRFPFLRQLEIIFVFINKNLYCGKLILPDFIVMTDKKVNFKFDDETYSIIVGSKFTQENCLSNFLHEIVHVVNYNASTCDTSSNQYHNKKFLSTALEMGLIVEFVENRGWEKVTIPIATYLVENATDTDKIKIPSINNADRLIKCLQSISIDEDLFIEAANELGRISVSTTSRVYQIKYVCKCAAPYNSIRSGRRTDGENPLKIKCLVCNSMFTEEGSADDATD